MPPVVSPAQSPPPVASPFVAALEEADTYEGPFGGSPKMSGALPCPSPVPPASLSSILERIFAQGEEQAKRLLWIEEAAVDIAASLRVLLSFLSSCFHSFRLTSLVWAVPDAGGLWGFRLSELWGMPGKGLWCWAFGPSEWCWAFGPSLSGVGARAFGL
jgi:hypothetical protein